MCVCEKETERETEKWKAELSFVSNVLTVMGAYTFVSFVLYVFVSWDEFLIDCRVKWEKFKSRIEKVWLFVCVRGIDREEGEGEGEREGVRETDV